jgi:hypothetical protein
MKGQIYLIYSYILASKIMINIKKKNNLKIFHDQ